MTTINCDMGESFGLYKMGDDAGLMPFIDIANVACGFHASDYNHMRATCRLAKAHGVRVGAHPSLPDLQGFGRREMKMGREELANCLIYQIGALTGFLEAEGMTMNHIKPHGALYGMAARDEETANSICDAALVFKTPLLGMKGSLHEKVYRARGVDMIRRVLRRPRLQRRGRRHHHARARRQGPRRGGGQMRARHERGQGSHHRRARRERRRRHDLRAFRHAERRRP